MPYTVYAHTVYLLQYYGTYGQRDCLIVLKTIKKYWLGPQKRRPEVNQLAILQLLHLPLVSKSLV